MRPWWILILLVPHTLAAEWTDGEADAAGPVSDGAMDLRALDIVEDETGFRITVTVGDLSPTAGWRLDAGRWYVYMEHDVERRVQFGRSLDGVWWTILEEANSGEPDGYAWVATLELEYDETAATLSTYVERSLLADGRGAPPAAGDMLGGIYAESQSHVGDMTDRLPDEGVLELPVVIGPEQTGAVRLSSADPWRATNGAASTYIYTVMVDNEGPATEVTFSTTDVPDGWSVLLPTPTVHIDEGGSTEVPVVLQTPSAHQHGARESFEVEARATGAPAEEAGRVTLGLEFLEVPQPAGHHDTLWFHSRSQSNVFQPVNEILAPGGWTSYVVMNAVEDEEADTKEAKEARPTSGPGGDDRAYWYIRLSPQLRMGLDFDLSRTGTIEVPVSAPVPVSDAVLRGWLYRCIPAGDDWDCDTLASLKADPMDLDGDQVMTATVVPEEVADRVEYVPESYLSLSLMVTSSRAQSGTGLDQLRLMPGGWMQLPLNEYADPVDDLFSSDVLSLQAATPELPVNAGVPTAFEAVLDNRLSDPLDVELSVSGTHADWARIDGSTERTLDALGRETVRVLVTPEAGAAIGERADLILHAKSDQGSSLVRLVATVSDEPVEAAEVTLDKESPGVGVATLGVLALASALLARRR